MNLLNIFKEFNTEEPFGIKPKFNLEQAREIFLNSTDEYEASLKLAVTWNNWGQMIRTVKFLKYVKEWRVEKKLRDQSELLKMYWDRAKKGDTSAQHTLFQRYFKEVKLESVNSVGRPKKEEVEDKAKQAEIIKAAQKHIKLAVSDGTNARPNVISIT